MKKIMETDLGYYYAKVSKEECLNWGGFGVCDLCGELFEEGYLIFVLGNCICGKCFKEWLRHSNKYDEDLEFQYKVSESWYKNHLGNNFIMPESYTNRKLEELNNENKELISKLDELDKDIEVGLKEIFKDELGGGDLGA